MGWDVTALGLPSANQPFAQGSFCQNIELPGVWLERARIRADDLLLINSPLGLAGQRCIATLFFTAGSKLERQRRQLALDLARQVLEAHPLSATAGATSPDAQVAVVRVLAPLVEPAMVLLKQVWKVWRQHFWGRRRTQPAHLVSLIGGMHLPPAAYTMFAGRPTGRGRQRRKIRERHYPPTTLI